MPNKVPKRVQRKRTKGSKLPPNTLCCTRPSKDWSNPIIGKDAAKWFRLWLTEFPNVTAYSIVSFATENGDDVSLHNKFASGLTTAAHFFDRLDELRQYDNLACFCGLDKDCHVDTLIWLLANGGA